MLLCCMYHHVGADKFSNSLALLERHLQYIKDNFNVVLPGDALADDTVNVCLVFDDASFSFYFYAYPLIKRIGIRVVLAVAPKFIVDSAANIAPHLRLRVPAEQMMEGDVYLKAFPFCSWEELAEIAGSGLVKFASHSYSHCNLLYCSDIESEVVKSKQVLHDRVQQVIDTFVYPYGMFNSEILDHIRKNYSYSFAVGAGDNGTWDGVGGVLFRIYADDLDHPAAIFTAWKLRKYRLMRYKLILKKWVMGHRRSRV